MPESTAPPPKAGAAGFIAAALLMLLLAGGLVFWKLRGSDKPPTPPPPPPPTTTTPIFEEPPPPPPPPTASEDAGSGQAPKKGPYIGGGCSGACKGEDSATLRSALAGKAGQARGCYERALRQNSTLQGHLVVAVRVGPQGQACSASVVSNGLGDPGVASCVVGMFRSAAFPAPKGGCVDAQVPMNFVPKGGGK